MPERGPYSTKAGTRKRFGQLSIWAEDGMVFLEWADTGDFHALEVPVADRRLGSMVEELALWDSKRDQGFGEEKAYKNEKFFALKAQLSALREAIAEAKAQGDPSDDTIRLAKLRQFLREKQAGTGNRNQFEMLFPDAHGRRTLVRGVDLPRPHQPVVLDGPATPTKLSWLS